jgi:hypothetical protein
MTSLGAVRLVRAAGRRRAGGRTAWCGIIAVLLWCAAPDPASAQEKFLGVDVERATGTYEAATDATLRATPKNDGRRTGVLRRGMRAEAVGRVGDWIAVRNERGEKGFVWESLLKVVGLPPLDRDPAGRVVDAEGRPLAPLSGIYIATADVTVRAKPAGNAKKRGEIEHGRQVEAFGSAGKGAWLAVRDGDGELGFVNAEPMVPVIDGSLKGKLTGRSLSGSRASCDYASTYTGQGSVPGEVFTTADYDVEWRCRYGARQLVFGTYMLITEAPDQVPGPPVYQVSIELLEVDADYDEAFSTVFLYDRRVPRVVFDSVTIKNFAADPKVKERPAPTVAEALAGAAAMAPTEWGEALWEALAKKLGH